MGIVLIPTDTDGSNIGQALVLNATMSEQNAVDNNITSHPRESTVDVTDNIIRRPRAFTCSGKISDSPSGFFQGAISQAIADIFTPDEASTLPPSKQIWDYLTQLAYWKYPFIVGTQLEVYTNMYIENASSTKNPRTYGGMDFSLTLREVLTATSATTESELEERKKTPSDAVKDRAAPKKAQGKKETKTVTPEQEQSILAAGIEWIAGQ